MNHVYNVALAWNAEEDADFVKLFRSACRRRNKTFLEITSDNFEKIQQDLIDKNISFKTFIDRGSDNDLRFMFLIQWSRENDVLMINKDELVSRAADKAAMHFALINHGLQTPYTILIPSYNEQPDIPPMELELLGEKFIVKPAHGGGGEGISTQASSWEQVLEVRKEYPDDTYLLQNFIVAKELAGKQAWFRVIYCSGNIYPCWWNTQTHHYQIVSKNDEKTLRLIDLRSITEKIAQICQLDIFSTEIALTFEDIFIVVDYVNDQIDLRLQSRFPDGVPDTIVKKVTQNLASCIK